MSNFAENCYITRELRSENWLHATLSLIFKYLLGTEI